MKRCNGLIPGLTMEVLSLIDWWENVISNDSEKICKVRPLYIIYPVLIEYPSITQDFDVTVCFPMSHISGVLFQNNWRSVKSDDIHWLLMLSWFPSFWLSANLKKLVKVPEAYMRQFRGLGLIEVAQIIGNGGSTNLIISLIAVRQQVLQT